MTDIDLPDVNVLVALVVDHHANHPAALEWWHDCPTYATTPVTESGLLRLLINPTIAGRHTSPAAALASLKSVRDHHRAHFLADTSSLSDPLLSLDGLVGHRQVTDLHLVNLAMLNRARLVTFDTKLAPTLQPADRDHILTLR